MAEDEVPPDDVVPEARRSRHIGRNIAIGIAALIGLLLLLVAGTYYGLNTDPGRRFVVRQINQLELASGLDIDVGRIEGNLYGGLVLHDLVLRDPKGAFFVAPRAELDWRPFAYWNKRVDIRSLVIPQARLGRLPELRPSGDPDAPLLPDLDIDIGRISIARLQVDPPVTGQRHLVSLNGRARIADRRAQVALNAGAIAPPALPGATGSRCGSTPCPKPIASMSRLASRGRPTVSSPA
jgi:translocation and assembly module TamB